MSELLPIDPEYLSEPHTIKRGDRFFRLVSRLTDTYYDDLSDDRIEELEAHIDQWRLCHADGTRFGQKG